MSSDVSPASEGTKTSLQGVSRALQALLLFRDEPQLGVREIARRLELNPAAAYRVLTTLADHGFVERAAGSRDYVLGNAIAQLGQAMRRSRSFSEIALPMMRKLQEETGETIGLHELRDGRRVCVLEIESNHELRMVVPMGEANPISLGGTDKVFRTFASDQELAQIDSVAAAEGTDASFAALPLDPAEREEIRERGWAISYGIRTMGAVALAAPVPVGSTLYALSVLGPTERMRTFDLDALGQRIRDVALEMTSALRALQSNGRR